LTVTFAFTVLVVVILSSSGTVLWWFLHDLRKLHGTVLEEVRSLRGVEALDPMSRT